MRRRLYGWCFGALLTALSSSPAIAEESKFFPLDILLVIDNSKSMHNEREDLAKRLDSLLSYVRFRDWRIGVVTTDPKDGCLRTVINRWEPGYREKFAKAIRVGSSGSGKERGFLQTVAALKNECGGKPWIRRHSQLAIIYASDEDNCSKDSMHCLGEKDSSPAYVMNYLRKIRWPGFNARVYGLIWHPAVPQSACSTAYHPGVGYASLIRRTFGRWGSICQRSFADSLEEISRDIASMPNEPAPSDQAPSEPSEPSEAAE